MSGMTITEKILAAHAGRDRVVPGEIVDAELDLVVCHDVTTPPAVDLLREHGITKVWDPSKIVVTPDHFQPAKDVQSALLAKKLAEWVAEQGIERYYPLGDHGICHALVPDYGHIRPGMTAVCGDSHTTTLGGVGAFAAGVGSTDLAAALMTGRLWFKVPESIRIDVTGSLPFGVFAKDLILKVISIIGVDGARYQAMEWCGPAIESLSMEGRLTLCNMAVEAGGKSGIVAPDEVTREYVRARSKEPFVEYQSDADARYVRCVEIDASALEPIVALPSLPSNGRPIGEVPETRIDQAYLGSCTNARIEDLRLAARVLRGHKVARNVRAMVVPATSRVWRQALSEGLLEVFAEAGCVVSTATCGACLGGYMGVLGEGDVCISSTNRNFVGRMGHAKSLVYLASPATVAASMIEGKIADPRPYLRTAAPATKEVA
jgi:3-isopropylmalate/(R)-2-methylmalate dehydratase large subunit